MKWKGVLKSYLFYINILLQTNTGDISN